MRLCWQCGSVYAYFGARLLMFSLLDELWMRRLSAGHGIKVRGRILSGIHTPLWQKKKRANWHAHKNANKSIQCNKQGALCLNVAKKWQGPWRACMGVIFWIGGADVCVRIALWYWWSPEALAWIKAFDTLWLPSHPIVPWLCDGLN